MANKESQKRPASTGQTTKAGSSAKSQKPKSKAQAKDKMKLDPKIENHLLRVSSGERLNEFIAIDDVIGRELNDAEFWHYLGDIYIGMEQLWVNRRVLNLLLGSPRPCREYIMNAEERKAFLVLPDEFTIHRGHVGRNISGWSWTLDIEKAKWFADRFPPSIHGGIPKITSGIVKKADVVAYFLQRQEAEIVVNPKLVCKKRTVVIASKWDEEDET